MLVNVKSLSGHNQNLVTEEFSETTKIDKYEAANVLEKKSSNVIALSENLNQTLLPQCDLHYSYEHSECRSQTPKVDAIKDQSSDTDTMQIINNFPSSDGT